MKISNDLSAEQCAAMFAMLRPGVVAAEPADVLCLGRLLSLCFDSGVTAALDRAQEEYRKRHSGGCKRITSGDECECFLCVTDRLRSEK